MANPHFEIKITKRSKRQSAVAGAAYQSGENLFSEYDQKHKDYRKKEGVVYTEIMLPSHAPPEYADREQLWNAVEAVENQWNSQLARRFVLALPREVPEELYPQMVQDYCNQFFVSKGMIVDFAIHDPKPPGHNPHCHVMLTMRAMDEHGKWLPKARKVYDLDENGERIRLPSGNWKSHKEDTVDWNEQYYGQEWRTGWETVQNRYLEMVNSPVRVDLRSYEKQGLDIIPTVHMGAAVTQMERRGIQTNIGNLNRDIKAANRMMSVIRSTIQNLRDWISDILEARKELLAEKKPETASPDLINLLRDYLNLRKAERRDWSRYGQQKGTTKDLQSFVNATNYLKAHEIFTLEQLDSVLEEVKQKSGSISTGMKKGRVGNRRGSRRRCAPYLPQCCCRGEYRQHSKGTPRRENPYPVRALEADRRTRPGGEVHRPLRMVNNNYQLYPQTPGVHGAQGFRENRLRELQDQKHPQDRAGGTVYF